MTPFSYLLVGHLIGDYLLQTRWMAENKAKKWLPLLVHSFVYTLSIALVAYIGFGGLSIYSILFIFLSHVFLDRRTFVSWWAENIMGAKAKEVAWLKIAADQAFHITVLAISLAF